MMHTYNAKKLLSYTLAVILSSIVACLLVLAAAEPKNRVTTDDEMWSPEHVENFSDVFFARAMARWHIPGAAFVLVKDGKVIFTKGYGYANLVKKIPVAPDKTVFRVASVSKVFTATAAMQLVESGKLDLHANVNRYLSLFKVRDPYPQPVTLAELLTHSAGLDASVIGIAGRNPSQVIPLEPFLAVHMPEAVMPPGKFYSYSSFGIALTGYLVQKISGEPFDAYIKSKILKPLNMRDSSFRLTPEMDVHLATGYEYHGGRYVAQPIDYFNIPPAVGLYSTATDMAHFLIMQIDDGEYNGMQILSDKALREMHRRQFGEDPRLAGRTFGFYERYVNGYRAIGHGGNIRGFASLLMLVPKGHVGFFLAFNRDESRFEDDFVQSFFGHFYPAKNVEGPLKPVHLASADLQKLTGSYRSNPYSRHTFEKLITLYWQFRITAKQDGTLEFHYPHNFKPVARWVPIAPNYFLCGDGQGHAVFEVNSVNRVTHLFTDRDSYEKVSWYGTAAFQVALVKALMLILLSGCVWWPIRALIHRWRKRPSGLSGEMRWACWTAGLLAVLDVFFIIEMLHLLTRMDDWDFVYGVPAGFKAMLWIPIVTTVLAAVVTGFTVRAWKKRARSLCGRIHYSTIAAAALVFIWFFAYWNLLGFRY